jgi:hypothetical protein
MPQEPTFPEPNRQKQKPVPPPNKIRGDNPPPTDEEQRSIFIKELDQLNNHVQLKIALGSVPILLLFVTSGFWFIVLLITVITVFGNIASESGKYTTKRADIIARARLKDLEFRDGDFHQTMVEMDAIQIDFKPPLADRSRLIVTIQFMLPRRLNDVPLNPYTYDLLPGDPRIVTQLNRVTEAKLMTYVQNFTEPPPLSSIEDHLNTVLVQFQNENKIPVLRVNVILVVHKHPDKPEGPLV